MILLVVVVSCGFELIEFFDSFVCRVSGVDDVICSSWSVGVFSGFFFYSVIIGRIDVGLSLYDDVMS